MEELITQFLDLVSTLGDHWAVAVAFVTALCAAVAIVLPAPTPEASALWRFVYKLINILGANVGRARNYDDVSASLTDSRKA